MALLDEAGVAAVSGDPDPLATGLVYCELVCALQGLAQYDVAEEWTEAMERWSRTNDPTDTGGLFMGRRPGTGPIRYRGTPERGGKRRRRADATMAVTVLVLEVLLCLTLWVPQPVAWLWVGSQVDYRTDSVSFGIAVAFAGMIGAHAHLGAVRAARPRVADPAPRGRPRAARGRAGAHLRGDRDRRRPRLPRLAFVLEGPAPTMAPQ